MRALRLIVVLILMLVSAHNIAADNQVENGYWWLSKDDTAKVWWVSGYVSAMERANLMIRDSETMTKNKLTDKVTGLLMADELNFYGVTFGQYIEGLDAFYQDYRNKRIQINSAIAYVRDDARGASKAEMEIRLENMRKATLTAGYDTMY
jgi:hypothetical protein